ncbi:UNC93 protein MFSD11 [Biomphalaria glabrata]|nr:UNC93 protein MFSD11 [Biomphalaria glabrata]
MQQSLFQINISPNVTPRSGRRSQADGQDVGTVGETRPEPRRVEEAGWWTMPQTRPQAEMVAYAPDETTGRDGGLCPRRDHRQRWWPMPQTRPQAEMVAYAPYENTGRVEMRFKIGSTLAIQ